MNTEITIREVTPNDWQTYAGLRLFGLQETPRGFGSTYVVEKDYKPDQWINWFGSRRYAILLAYDKEQPVGMAVLIDNLDDVGAGEVVSLYVKGSHRGRGISSALLSKSLDLASENKKWEKLEARCRQSNVESQRTICARGFRLMQSITAEWPGGVQEIRHDYVIDLGDLRRQKTQSCMKSDTESLDRK